MNGSPACPRLLDRDWLGSLAGEVETGDPEKGLAQGMMGEQEASASTKSRCATSTTQRDTLHIHSRSRPTPRNQIMGRFRLFLSFTWLKGSCRARLGGLSFWILEQPPLGAGGVPSW